MHVQSCWVAFAQQRLHYDKFWFGAVLTWWWSVSHTDRLSQPVATVAGQDCYKSSCWPVLHRSTGFKKQTAPIIIPSTTSPWTPITEGITGKSRLSSRCWGLRGWEGGRAPGGGSAEWGYYRIGNMQPWNTRQIPTIRNKTPNKAKYPQHAEQIPNLRKQSPNIRSKASNVHQDHQY